MSRSPERSEGERSLCPRVRPFAARRRDHRRHAAWRSRWSPWKICLRERLWSRPYICRRPMTGRNVGAGLAPALGWCESPARSLWLWPGYCSQSPGREHLVEWSQVVDTVQVRLTLPQEAQRVRPVGRLLQGTGERVVGDVEMGIGQCQFLARQRFARDTLDLAVYNTFRISLMDQDILDRINMRLEELTHQVGMLIEEFRARYDLGSHKFSAAPERALIKKDLTVPFYNQACSPWLGHPGPIDCSYFEQGQNIGVIRRKNLYGTAFIRCLEAMLLEVIAQSHVLSAAKLRRGNLLAAEILRTLDIRTRSHNEQRAAARRTSNDAQCLAVAFHIAVDRWIGPYIPDINLISKESLDLCRTGVEDLWLQL